jgi:AcrR family transcriptional regulator
MSPRGRRSAGEDTRQLIVDAARTEFATKGYDASSLRAIARLAGVDPALVHHYFDGKPHLFAEAVAVPFRPADVIAGVLSGPRAEVGERLADAFFTVWEIPASRERFVAMVRSAVSHEEAARMLRELLARDVFGRLAGELGVADAELRAGLAAAQVVGVAMLRYVVGHEPLVAADPARLAALVAPTLQRYLVDPDA